jgi:tetratricopeptide (TPR) repeat protein
VAQAFAGRPEEEALVRGVLGQAYSQVARYPDAVRELGRAWELRCTLNRTYDADALTVLNNYGVAVLQSGDLARGRELLQEAHERRLALLGAAHRDTLESRSLLALTRQLVGDVAGAIADTRAVVADQERILGRTHRDTLDSLCSLADMLESVGQLEESLAVAQDAAQRAVAAYGPDSHFALMARSILAETLDSLDRYEEASELLREVVSGKEKLYGDSHPETLLSLDLLAATLSHQEKHEEALDLYRTVVARAMRALGERHPSTLVYQNNLAQALRRMRQFDEAEPIYRRVLALRREINGERSQDTLIVMSNLGLLLLERGTPADAEPLLHAALDGFRHELPAGNWMIGVALVNMGRCQTALHSFTQAETSLTEAHTLLAGALGPTNGRTLSARTALAELYDAWGKPDQAQTWRAPP